MATSEDAEAIASLYRRSGLAGAPADAGLFERMVQTGHAFLVAEHDGTLLGAVRNGDEEGIAWFDLLVSARAWMGAELVRAVERSAQDRGIRLVRAHCPDSGLLPGYFSWLGYRPIGRQAGESGEPGLLLERRLPLLTVREQRRSDAAAIEALTGEDAWVFEQGARPGWFVAADGDRVAGAIQCAGGSRGIARISEPWLAEAYRGRSLELWMVERAAMYAETNGYHTAEMEAVAELEPLRKGLEERYWVRDGQHWKRVFFTPPSGEDWD